MRFFLAESSMLQSLTLKKKNSYSKIESFSTFDMSSYFLKDAIKNFVRYSQSRGNSYSKISIFWSYKLSLFDLIIDDHLNNKTSTSDGIGLQNLLENKSTLDRGIRNIESKSILDSDVGNIENNDTLANSIKNTENKRTLDNNMRNTENKEFLVEDETDLFDIDNTFFSYSHECDYIDLIDSIIVASYLDSDFSETLSNNCLSENFINGMQNNLLLDYNDYNQFHAKAFKLDVTELDNDSILELDDFYYSDSSDDDSNYFNDHSESSTDSSDSSSDEEDNSNGANVKENQSKNFDIYNPKIGSLQYDVYIENEDNLLMDDVGLRVVFTKVPKSLRKNTKGERRFTSYLDFCDYTKSLGYWWRLHRLATLSVFGDHDFYGNTYFSFKEFQVLNWYLEFNYSDNYDLMFTDFYRWQRETIYSYIETGLSSLDKKMSITTNVYDEYVLKKQTLDELKSDNTTSGSVSKDDSTDNEDFSN